MHNRIMLRDLLIFLTYLSPTRHVRMLIRLAILLLYLPYIISKSRFYLPFMADKIKSRFPGKKHRDAAFYEVKEEDKEGVDV